MSIASMTQTFGRRPAFVGGCGPGAQMNIGADQTGSVEGLRRRDLYLTDDAPLGTLGGCGDVTGAGCLGFTPEQQKNIDGNVTAMRGALLFGLTWAALATVSMAVSAYHGYKRNDSVGWALWWGWMGSMFPVVVPVIAIAQGYGVRERSGNPTHRRVRRSNPVSRKKNFVSPTPRARVAGHSPYVVRDADGHVWARRETEREAKQLASDANKRGYDPPYTVRMENPKKSKVRRA